MGDKIKRASKREFFIGQNMIFDLDISINAKITYLYLCRCADDESQAFPSYNTIAKKCSFSRRTAMRAIQELQDIGLLSVENRKILKNDKMINTSNLYILYDSPNKEDTSDATGGGDTQSLGGGDTQSLGVVTHSHQGGDTQSPRTIPNEEYPYLKSVCLSIDGLTDLNSQINYDELINKYPEHDKLIKDIQLVIEDMQTATHITIEGDKKHLDVIRSVLSRLNTECIEAVLLKLLETLKVTPIRKIKNYIQVMVYNTCIEYNTRKKYATVQGPDPGAATEIQSISAAQRLKRIMERRGITVDNV